MLNLREPTNVLIFQVSVREKYRSSFESLYSSLLLLLLVYHRLIRISLLMASLSVADRELFLFIEPATFLEVQLQLYESPCFKVSQIYKRNEYQFHFHLDVRLERGKPRKMLVKINGILRLHAACDSEEINYTHPSQEQCPSNLCQQLQPAIQFLNQSVPELCV